MQTLCRPYANLYADFMQLNRLPGDYDSRQTLLRFSFPSLQKVCIKYASNLHNAALRCVATNIFSLTRAQAFGRPALVARPPSRSRARSGLVPAPGPGLLGAGPGRPRPRSRPHGRARGTRRPVRPGEGFGRGRQSSASVGNVAMVMVRPFDGWPDHRRGYFISIGAM
jgi:hypothetical protein